MELTLLKASLKLKHDGLMILTKFGDFDVRSLGCWKGISEIVELNMLETSIKHYSLVIPTRFGDFDVMSQGHWKLKVKLLVCLSYIFSCPV